MCTWWVFCVYSTAQSVNCIFCILKAVNNQKKFSELSVHVQMRASVTALLCVCALSAIVCVAAAPSGFIMVRFLLSHVRCFFSCLSAQCGGVVLWCGVQAMIPGTVLARRCFPRCFLPLSYIALSGCVSRCRCC